MIYEKFDVAVKRLRDERMWCQTKMMQQKHSKNKIKTKSVFFLCVQEFHFKCSDMHKTYKN